MFLKVKKNWYVNKYNQFKKKKKFKRDRAFINLKQK